MTKLEFVGYDAVGSNCTDDPTLDVISSILDTQYESWIPVIGLILHRLDGVQEFLADERAPHAEIREIYHKARACQYNPTQIAESLAALSGWQITASDGRSIWEPMSMPLSEYRQRNKWLLYNETPLDTEKHRMRSSWLLKLWLANAPTNSM